MRCPPAALHVLLRYFDSDDAARSIFTSAFPSTVCAGSFADALAPGSPFVRCATLARVGFASPPCVDISIVNSKRQESSACAELTVDCVRALRLVRHEVLCLETTTTVTSARGGRLLQSVYEAADDVGYVPHLMCLDPLRLGGCQSRCRAYIVFVRRDVYTRRGPFAPPSSYAICGAPTPMRMMLDPVSSLPPAVDDGIVWNVVDRVQQPGYTGPILCATATLAGRKLRCYSIDGPAPCLLSGLGY